MHKSFIFFRLRIKRFVVQGGFQGRPLLDKRLGSIAQIHLRKALPDVFHSLSRWVQHILGIEPVVAQFIVHDLVSREVAGARHLAGSQKQRSLRELGTMIAVFAIANGADGEYDAPWPCG